MASAATPLDDRGCAISHDLGHCLAHLRGIEAHHHDRIGAHGSSVLDHPVDRVAAGILDEACVLDDLATAECTKARQDVAAQAAASHHDSEHLAESLLDLITGRAFGGGDEHGSGRHFDDETRG